MQMLFTAEKTQEETVYTTKIKGGEIKVFESGLEGNLNKYQAILSFTGFNLHMFCGFGPTVETAAKNAVSRAVRFLEFIGSLNLDAENDEHEMAEEFPNISNDDDLEEIERPYRQF